jgi:hypothetical protein
MFLTPDVLIVAIGSSANGCVRAHQGGPDVGGLLAIAGTFAALAVTAAFVSRYRSETRG